MGVLDQLFRVRIEGVLGTKKTEVSTYLIHVGLAAAEDVEHVAVGLHDEPIAFLVVHYSPDLSAYDDLTGGAEND